MVIMTEVSLIQMREQMKDELADELAIELAGRFSNYSTVGKVYTWKGGVDWRLTDDIRLRGSFNRAIRAPILNRIVFTQIERNDWCNRPVRFTI